MWPKQNQIYTFFFLLRNVKYSLIDLWYAFQTPKCTTNMNSFLNNDQLAATGLVNYRQNQISQHQKMTSMFVVQCTMNQLALMVLYVVQYRFFACFEPLFHHHLLNWQLLHKDCDDLNLIYRSTVGRYLTDPSHESQNALYMYAVIKKHS